MARKTRSIPQKTLSPADRETFEHMIETISSQVGVFINKQPYNFILDTRIFTDTNRFPVARPKTPSSAWGGYFAYTPSYAALNPEQRWNYVAWLYGQEALGIQMFRIMRIHALCCELAGARKHEAIVALRELYQQSQGDTVSMNMIGNLLSLSYAALEPAQLDEWLTIFQPTSAMPIQLQAYVYSQSQHEAPGVILLDLALQHQFRLARGMSNRKEQIANSIDIIATQWSEREGGTIITKIVNTATFVPLVFAYNDTLMMWVCRTLDIPQGSLKLDEGPIEALIHALATAAQEHVRSRRKGSEELDGLQLLDGIIQGDSTVVQFDVSGTTSYTMTAKEEQALKNKLEQVQDVLGITLIEHEWDLFDHWQNNYNLNADAAIIKNLPIKKPSSPQPLHAPAPPTYSTAAYKTLTPEQRWWYLDWVLGQDIEPLQVFFMVRFKGLEVALQELSRHDLQIHQEYWHRYERDDQATSIFTLVEDMAAQSDNETLLRRAALILMPLYGMYAAGEKATALFERVSFTPEQGPEMLEFLWDAQGELTGRGLLNIARSGGFNHTPLTKECFDQIAEKAIELLTQWEETYGPLNDLPITTFAGRRNRRVKTVLSVTADIAREAQEQIKLERRKAPRSNRMSEDELAAEREELADLPIHAGDEPSERLYQQLCTEPRLLQMYLAEGVQALEQAKPDQAVAFLRRAYEIDDQSPAKALLPFARAHLAAWQRTQGEESRS